MEPILGREQELVALRGFAQGEGSAVLRLEGEAGIGKTTLWLAGLEAAAAAGVVVLRARPVGAEAKLSFTGLCDLFSGVDRDVLGELPPPQRRVLEVALMLESPADAAPDLRAVAVATHEALRALSSRCRVLVGIDDIQWLDAPTGAVIGYAARRLAGEPVRFLLALRRRPGDAVLAPLEALERGERTTRMVVGPLTLAATHRLIHTRLDQTLARPILRRVHETAGGNPFTALELARAIAAVGGSPGPSEPLPVPLEIRELVRRRLSGLEPEAMEALLAAALLANPSLDMLEAMLPGAGARLAPALAAELIELEADQVRFAHPLFGSGVVQLAGERRRREMHRRLADAVDDVEEHALHLALATAGADEAVAATLDEAAQYARARAAPGAAADLLERAFRLTPADRVDERERRRHEASTYYWIAGDDLRAAALLSEAVDSLKPGPHRGRACSRLARLKTHAGWLREALELDRRALAEPGDDPRARAEAHENLAWTLLFQRRDLHEAARHARAALALAQALGDSMHEMDALSALGQAEFLLGGGLPSPATGRALALAESARDASTLRLATVHAALLDLCADDFEQARARYEQARRHAVATGDEWAASWVWTRLALLECVAGRWSLALDHVSAVHDITGAKAEWMSRLATTAIEALILAFRGDVERARLLGDTAVGLGEERAAGVVLHPALWALGTLELGLGDAAAAERHLSRLWELAESGGIGDPGERRFSGDLVDAWLSLGRPDDALRVVEWLERRGGELRRPSALAVAARGRGLLAAEARDPDAAEQHFERALSEHDRAPLPYERARTLLAFGRVLRRARRKRLARARLTEARDAFGDLGAALWAARAESELSRIGGRAPTTGGLTPTEEKVAALVVEGRTNREVAAALFLSERTVEACLSHIYAKLGVRSRVQLAGRYLRTP